MGMAVANDEAGLRTEYDKVRAFAGRMFGDGSVLIERYFPRVRHVEVQILGLADGRVIALSERECSVQRRNQKLVEEAPSPAVGPELRARFLAAAVKAGEAVNYRNAGTVECLLDPATGEFFFLEMNTRLQVEHPITELIHGIDLVEEQLRIASGEAPTFDPDALTSTGHAIELRVNAEDPKRFLPGPGKVATWVEPTGEGVRVDAGYAEGTTVTPNYDSLMAKLIVFGTDRADAIAKARTAVAGFEIAGPKNNLPFFAELLENQEFLSGDYDTGIVSRMR
jgi:acetyl-CoA carboxylase biotin carboxylase subunit